MTMVNRLAELRCKRERYLDNIRFFLRVVKDYDSEIAIEEQRQQKSKHHGKTLPRTRR
jgi:hypothetical protein